MSKRLRVLVADDHPAVTTAVTRLLSLDCDVVGSVADGALLLEEARRQRPDVVLLDLNLPSVDGLTACREITGALPEIKVVVFTAVLDPHTEDRALAAGASAFVSKDAPADDVVAAARHATVSPRSFTAADLADAMRRKMSPSGPQLSPRETEVLGLLAEGLGVSAIARQLFVSESTAKTHISKIYEKLGTANRAQAIMIAIRSGLLSDEQPL